MKHFPRTKEALERLKQAIKPGGIRRAFMDNSPNMPMYFLASLGAMKLSEFIWSHYPVNSGVFWFGWLLILIAAAVLSIVADRRLITRAFHEGYGCGFRSGYSQRLNFFLRVMGGRPVEIVAKREEP